MERIIVKGQQNAVEEDFEGTFCVSLVCKSLSCSIQLIRGKLCACCLFSKDTRGDCLSARIIEPNCITRQWIGRLEWRNSLLYSVVLNKKGCTIVTKKKDEGLVPVVEYLLCAQPGTRQKLLVRDLLLMTGIVAPSLSLTSKC
eukprot:1375056-Ditylum_brightwellii.AAC.1